MNFLSYLAYKSHFRVLISICEGKFFFKFRLENLENIKCFWGLQTC